MRSRYSAFAVGDEAYLLRTWHPTTRPRRLRLDPDRVWTALEILGRTRGGLFDSEGTVEFRAHYRDGRRGAAGQELSRFVRVDGHWLYVEALE
jgi:SEC-C motif-containing protein